MIGLCELLDTVIAKTLDHVALKYTDLLLVWFIRTVLYVRVLVQNFYISLLFITNPKLIIY